MQAIDQTTFGEGLGNCFSACVASILELPIEEVPFFGADELWWTRFAEWLEARNLYPVCLKHRPGRAPVGYHILSGKSPRGEFMHSVVAKGEDIVHDPHPSRANIQDRVDTIIMVPMDFGDHKRELATLRERVAAVEADNVDRVLAHTAIFEQCEELTRKCIDLETELRRKTLDAITVRRQHDDLRERVAKLEALGPWIESHRATASKWKDATVTHSETASNDATRERLRVEAAEFRARELAFEATGRELNNRAGKDLRGHGQ